MSAGAGIRFDAELAGPTFVAGQRPDDAIAIGSLDGQGVVKRLSQGNKDLEHRFQLDAGVSEGYTIGEHTAMVINEARRYRESKTIGPVVEKFMSWDEFVMFLALHDIGKGASNEAENDNIFSTLITRKASELRSTREWLDANSVEMRISDRTKAIYLALLENDTVGSYLKGEIPTDQFFYEIVSVSSKLEVEPSDFCDLLCAFHMVDAASYPGLKRLLFREDGSDFRYSSDCEKKLKPIQEKLAAASAGQRLWEEIDRAADLPHFVVAHSEELRAYIEMVIVHIVKDAGGNDSAARLLSQRIAGVFEKLTGIECTPANFGPRWLTYCSAPNMREVFAHNRDSQINWQVLAHAMYFLYRMDLLNQAGIDVHFVHGTRSTTLALMEATDHQLMSSGALARFGVVPLAGEQSHIIGSGINMTGISAASVEDSKTASLRYTSERLHGDADYDSFVRREVGQLEMAVKSYEDRLKSLERLRISLIEKVIKQVAPDTFKVLSEKAASLDANMRSLNDKVSDLRILVAEKKADNADLQAVIQEKDSMVEERNRLVLQTLKEIDPALISALLEQNPEQVRDYDHRNLLKSLKGLKCSIGEKGCLPYLRSMSDIRSVGGTLDGYFLGRVALAVQRLQVLGETDKLVGMMPKLKEMIAVVQATRADFEWKTDDFFAHMPRELNDDPELEAKRGDRKFGWHDSYYYSYWVSLVEGANKLEAILNADPLPEAPTLKKLLEKPFPVVFGFKAHIHGTSNMHEYKVLHPMRIGGEITAVFTSPEGIEEVESTLEARSLKGRVRVLDLSELEAMEATAKKVMDIRDRY